ncbi:MAG: TIM44-like domain-containing protein [Magnetospirillum sp.]|nr:TIM44-like domain-containing protein [Magnetospirillum sp.]
MRHVVTVLFLALALVASPEAFAKAGKGGSFGSRGTRTYDRPMERSVAPPAPSQPSTAQPMYNPNTLGQQPMAAAAMPAAGGFFQRNPFMGGIMGGLVGAGIGSMLFGHSPAMAAASGASPVGSMLGTLFQFALIGGLIWLAVRFFRRRAEGVPAAGSMAPRREMLGQAGGGAQPRTEREFEPTDEDRQAFGEILVGVQKAWTEGNAVALSRLATPEIGSWLSEDLASDASRGLRNMVTDVELRKGDVLEAWREGEREYVTTVLTFAALDYVVRVDDDSLVEGSKTDPVETTEAWTFTRTRGGRWLLSAIERE